MASNKDNEFTRKDTDLPPPVQSTQSTYRAPLSDGPQRPPQNAIRPPQEENKRPPAPSIPVSVKAFERPGATDEQVQTRTYYRHTKRCKAVNEMTPEMAKAHVETPADYPAAHCWKCRDHFPIAEFTWLSWEEGREARPVTPPPAPPEVTR